MNIALITAAGSGKRMGLDIPKQFFKVEGKPIIIYTLEAFQKNKDIDKIVIACLKGWEELLKEDIEEYKITKVEYIIEGGDTNFQSIRNMVYKAKKQYDERDIVVIHDGDRPLVSDENINDAIEKCKKYGTGIAAIPSYEALFFSDDNIKSNKQVDRDKIRRIQTPNAFKLKDLYDSYKEAERKGITESVGAVTLFIELGKKVYFSRGADENIKITVPIDLEIFKLLVKQRYKNS